MHQVLNPSKALRTMRKTPTILTTLLHGVPQAQAETWRDGADGWSVLYIICHLRDIETLFMQRVEDMLAQPHPTFAVISNDQLIQQHNYGQQEMRHALAEYQTHRQAFLALLEPLTDEQWQRTGMHPEQGPATVLDIAVNTGLHDVDHLEQIVRCMEPHI